MVIRNSLVSKKVSENIVTYAAAAKSSLLVEPLRTLLVVLCSITTGTPCTALDEGKQNRGSLKDHKLLFLLSPFGRVKAPAFRRQL